MTLTLVPNVCVLDLDVTKEDDIEKAYAIISTDDSNMALWAVVSNAGVATVGPLEWHSAAKIRTLFDVNVIGAAAVVLKFLPLLKKSQGRIVIVSSMFGRMTAPLVVPYCMTKHACVSLADGLRRTLRTAGIQVSTIEPTGYRTAISDPKAVAQHVDELIASLPSEVRKDVNQEKVSKLKILARVFSEGLMRDDPSEVVRDMVSALREKHPKAHYRTGGPADRVVRLLDYILPSEVADYMLLTLAQSNGVKEKSKTYVGEYNAK
ncbi:short-chain dehydrogenase/reductase family 9C member 7 [Rhipicephalus sanguineus]|uniref:short-chain dehydrogenase/reductase family 9C member 7 n=1 Tax=Rhipicephalus sanguineus TaxID=34632 RepID=UPI00189633BF|nr:short-chain dehydrogenase/reductase family 9C member 7 [Rhipicephalus sanguineus]